MKGRLFLLHVLSWESHADPQRRRLRAAGMEEQCAQCNGRGFLVVCDGCDDGYHVYCADLAFPPQEADRWLCSDCTPLAAHVSIDATEAEATFECVVCFETRSESHKLAVVGCEHTDYVCTKCMFTELCEHESRCPLCRRQADQVRQVVTGYTRDIDPVTQATASGEAEGGGEEQNDDDDDDGGDDDDDGGDDDDDEAEDEEQLMIIAHRRAQARARELPDSAEAAVRRLTSPACTIIDLDRMGLSARRTADLATALRNNQSLTLLNLSRNPLRDAGTEAIAEALRVNHTLTRLFLDECGIGDGGCKVLARVLPHEVLSRSWNNTTLRLLSLDGNALITDASARRLANVRTLLALALTLTSARARLAMRAQPGLRRLSVAPYAYPS